MEPTILRSKVFQEIHSGEPFDAVWITCDRRRGTGGELISAESWMVVSAKADNPEPRHDPEPGKPETRNPEPETRKDPNHPEHGTVNIFNPGNAGIHPHKVHIDLIQFFNGKRVIN